jgi:ubiquinone/menaquinone biosynthesis C-methylase UbiE
MGFEVSADAYGRFMGRYSEPLADHFVDFAGVESGARALDVGCGPGALTARLVDRLGAEAVAAIDPSASFVEATRQRFPDADVRAGGAEQLPFADDGFDLALAQLVVHFMKDPVAGLREMSRVTKSGGVVAASVWDHASKAGPSSVYWEAVKSVDPTAADQGTLAGAREGHLVELFESAGLKDIEQSSLTVRVPYTSFDEWWEPYTMGVGPAGEYVAKLDTAGREALQRACRERLPEAPFEVAATSWCVRARA